MREPTRGQADPGSRTSEHLLKVQDLRGVVRILVRTPSYVLDTLGMTAMTFALGGLGAWMPDYIFRNKLGIADPESLGPAEREQLLAPINLRFGGILAVSGIVATLLGGMVGDWLRRRYAGSYFLVSGISMLLGFPVILLVLYTGYPWYWIFTFLACFCLFFNTGPTNTVLANVTHPAMRARAFGLNIFVLHAFGDAVSPAIIGLISGFSSQEVGFITVSVLVLVGGLLWLWGARYLARDTALAPNRLG